MTDDKKYLVNDRPVSASELIREAACLDADFDADWFKPTSVAAQILRDNGYTIRENRS